MIKKPKAAIIDYGMGNLFSVRQAFHYVGLNAEITSEPNRIFQADALVLPGVGAFGDAIQKLRDKKLIGPIKDSIKDGKPFMGICLGMQLLMSKSSEFGEHDGLNVIKGKVKRLSDEKNHIKVKIPHMQWNRISWPRSDPDIWNKSPLTGIINGEFMYFVHSYYAEPEDSDIVLSLTNYGGLNFCSSLLLENIFACQFHPEKSGKEGIKVYKNWANMI